MDLSNMGTAMLMQFAWLIPYLIVCLVGIILALNNWTRKPAAAMLTVVALLLLLVCALSGTVLSMLPMVLIRKGWPPSQINVLMGAFGMIRILLEAGGIGLLLAAIFPRENRSAVLPSPAEWPSK